MTAVAMPPTGVNVPNRKSNVCPGRSVNDDRNEKLVAGSRLKVNA